MGVRIIFAIVALHVAVVMWFLFSLKTGFIDLRVYRLGADVWRSGGDLYGDLPTTNLSFTYPPISAVLLSPFALIPVWLGSAVLTALSVTALAVVLVLVLRSLDIRPSWSAVGLLLPLALVMEPVRTTLDFGQVNLLLMALVALDCLARGPRWPRGALIGLAAAVKLTPAVFVLFFLVRGDRRAALTSVVSFLGVTALGFVLNWRGSVRFWTSTVFNTDRIGTVTSRGNQSITALLARLGLEPGVRGVVWLVLAAALIVVGVVGMRRAGHPALALGLCALTALPVSPVAWSHHWVWCVPVLLCLGVAAWRTRAPLAIGLAAGGTLLFLLAPHGWWDKTDPWTVGRILPGNAYLWFAVVTLCLAARTFAAIGLSRSQPGSPRTIQRVPVKSIDPARTASTSKPGSV